MNIILKNGSGEIEEKKSRFICHIFKIKSEEEAEEYIIYQYYEEKILGCKT